MYCLIAVDRESVWVLRKGRKRTFLGKVSIRSRLGFRVTLRGHCGHCYFVQVGMSGLSGLSQGVETGTRRDDFIRA
jgi:hypothetical protein